MKCVNKKSVFAIPVLLAGLLLAGCGGGESGQRGVQDTTTTQRQNDPVVATNKAILSWDAPLTRANGDSIDMGELDTYIIRYGRSEDELTNEIVLDNGTAQEDSSLEYVVDGLDAGTWYFTVQVRDFQGLLSEPSNVVSKTI
jgi:hypothetical protein